MKDSLGWFWRECDMSGLLVIPDKRFQWRVYEFTSAYARGAKMGYSTRII